MFAHANALKMIYIARLTKNYRELILSTGINLVSQSVLYGVLYDQ